MNHQIDDISVSKFLKIDYFFSKIVKYENQNSAAPRGLRAAQRKKFGNLSYSGLDLL